MMPTAMLSTVMLSAAPLPPPLRDPQSVRIQFQGSFEFFSLMRHQREVAKRSRSALSLAS